MFSKRTTQKLQCTALAVLAKVSAVQFKKGLCLALLATTLVITAPAFASSIKASMQSRVKAYIFMYGQYLLSMYVSSAQERYLKETTYIGNYYDIQDNKAWLHGYEVALLVSSGKLDDCCWRATPTKYKNLVSATSAEILEGLSVPNPGKPGTKFDIPPMQQKIFKDLLAQMYIVNEGYDPVLKYPWPTFTWEFLFNRALIKGYGYKTYDSVMDKLVWTYSYVNLSYLKPEFKNYYSFACVICYDAGFYDLRGLYDTNPATKKPYYQDIINSKSLPQTYYWLILHFNKFYHQAPFYGYPPPQLSMGPTLQGKPYTAVGKLDDASIYPVHCHQAQETYFTIDPLNYTKNSPQGPLGGYPGSKINTDSYFAGKANHYDKYPSWQADMSNQFPGNYVETPGANVVYNRPRAYHSMHAGKVVQFTTWARLTRPEEGTYFPLNDPKKPHPKEGACSADGVPPVKW